jgi:hypothetical protein
VGGAACGMNLDAFMVRPSDEPISAFCLGISGLNGTAAAAALAFGLRGGSVLITFCEPIYARHSLFA